MRFPRDIVKVPVIILAVFALDGPIMWMILGAFKTSSSIVGQPYNLFPAPWSLDGFHSLFQQTDFLRYAKNSVVVALIVTVVAVGTAFLAAVGTRFKRRGLEALVRSVTTWTYMFSPIVLVLPQYALLRRVGLFDTTVGLCLAQMPICYALAFWVISPFVRDCPRSLEESAMLDGAGGWRLLGEVTARWCRPGIVAASALTFLVSWNDFVSARVLVSGVRKTIPVGIQDIFESTIVDWSMLLAAGVLAIVPVGLAVGVGAQFFVDRHGVGGVKG